MDSKTEKAEQLQTRLLKLTIKGFALKKAIAEMNSEEVTRAKFVSQDFHNFLYGVGYDGAEIYFSVLIAIENDLKAQLKDVRDELIEIKKESNRLIENELLND
jgi:hypothetical protein